MAWQSHLRSRDVHFVASQDGIGVLLCPEVVVLRCGLLRPAWLNPAHLNGMNQLANLMAAQGKSMVLLKL